MEEILNMCDNKKLAETRASEILLVLIQGRPIWFQFINPEKRTEEGLTYIVLIAQGHFKQIIKVVVSFWDIGADPGGAWQGSRFGSQLIPVWITLLTVKAGCWTDQLKPHIDVLSSILKPFSSIRNMSSSINGWEIFACG